LATGCVAYVWQHLAMVSIQQVQEGGRSVNVSTCLEDPQRDCHVIFDVECLQ
jgi:hypothetical protein